MSRALTVLTALCIASLVCAGAFAEEVLIEAEDFARADDQTFMPAYASERENASGGRMVAVRGKGTGAASWLDFRVTVEGGLYELLIRAGGNNSRQAGMVGIDGGKPVTVLDDPPSALPLGGALPADFKERSKYLERTFREHRVGSVELPAGKHRIRVQHAGLEGRSNAFGFDCLKLVSVDASEAPRIEVGNEPEIEGSRADRQPVELHVLTSYRFWGPDETPCYALLFLNREQAEPAAGKYTVDLVSAETGQAAMRLSHGEITELRRGQYTAHSYEIGAADLPRGTYWIRARWEVEGGETLTDEAEMNLVELNTPGWAKRARVKWARYRVGGDIDKALENVTGLVEQGINVVVNANVFNFFGGETISYPFRGSDENLRRFLDVTHELGACQLMYHSMITIHEHFYYEHKDFWGGRKPFYHCSWLSIYPDSAQWNAYQARDFEFFIRKFPLDGIFLDNASASGWPEARTEAGEEAIAHHQETMRAAIKRANPTGVLYPNYNTMTREGLRTVARAWDAHMLEGAHPAPRQHVAGRAWQVRKFVEVAEHVRRLTGKPFWPLMYMPGKYQKLCIGACGAGRANPCGPVDEQYLHFMGDIQEYLYADDVFPMPAETATLTTDDPDLAVTALVKLYRHSTSKLALGPRGGLHVGPRRDWLIQIVNGAEENEQPVERDVELALDLPARDLARGGYLLRPEQPHAEKIELTDPLKLKVGSWTVLVVADDLLPRVRVSPALIAPVSGEQFNLAVKLQSWTDEAARAHVRLLKPPGWASAEGVAVGVDGTAQLVLAPPRDAEPGNRELTLRITWGERVADLPLLARVKPRLGVTLNPDHFGVMGNTSAETELRVANHTSGTVSGNIKSAAPDGWSLAPDTANFSVAAGGTTALLCRITWPEFEPQSLYDLRDGDLRVSVEAGGEAVTATIPVRLHMPVTWVIYCPLGTRPADVVRTGATPGGGMLSDLLLTVRGHPRYLDDAGQAVARAVSLQQTGEQRVVLWFRTGQEGSDQLGEPEVAAGLARFMELGGGVVLHENVFRDSEANRALLASDVCPIAGPYSVTETPGGDWSVTEPEHPAIARFAAKALEGGKAWGIPEHAQPTAVKFTVKPWAQVVACNGLGEPVMVVSNDPARPVAYLAGSLEGTYMDQRYGLREYPDQMARLLYFYAELARWLSSFGGTLEKGA